MQEQSQGSSLDEPLISPQPMSWYPKPTGVFDEVFSPTGSPLPHWDYIVNSIDAMGHQELADRQKKAQSILRDDGATFNLLSLPLKTNAWTLDPIPMLISSEEWADIESGLIERSELFNLILKDIYGERTLIKQGILPPEIIFDHPGFIRQCQDIRLNGQHQLLMQAMDLIRLPDGTFTIVSDRTQAPNGAGYALENRTVLSRVLPSMFRDSQVHRLSLYFHTLRQTLSTLGRHLSVNPRIVVLTPGTQSASYFEHTFLANYLGYSLVQGSDLTVRRGKLWMKALNGLKKVDVILRRVDDVFCDQAELLTDRYTGVPGLLEVIREGNVVVANPLGSGILETPALLKYLPAISQYFLGHPLKIPSVQTWWCGDSNDLDYVTANIGNLIIKQSIRRYGKASVYGRELTIEQQKKLIEKIKLSPHRYVAQGYVSASQTASWQGDRISSQPTILRTFTVSNLTSYSAMPGGLSRVSNSNHASVVTNYFSSQSKDTWILASEPEKHLSLLDQTQGNTTEYDAQANLPSRVIENLFWMGRYAERAETSLRLLRTVFIQLENSDPLPFECQKVLLRSLSIQTGSIPGFCAEELELFNQPEAELLKLITDKKSPGSIKSNLRFLVNCSEQVKEMLSADTRKIINDLQDHILQLDSVFKDRLPAAPEEFLDDIVTSLLALSGLNHESMLRGVDWRFQALGRRTERAVQTATLIRSAFSYSLPQYEQQQIIESVLLTVEALISYRRRYRTQQGIACGLDLIMMDESNPRSLYYQFNELLLHTEKLPRSETSVRALSPEIKIILKSINDIQLANLEGLAQINTKTKRRDALVDLMTSLLSELEAFTTALSDKYFDHMTVPQQLVRPNWEQEI